jgi:hypothetical protein
MEDTVAVEGVGVGVDSPSKTSQEHYLARVVKLGPARTMKAMYFPSNPATKEKMVTCYAHPRRSWLLILEPTMGMMHVRSSSLKKLVLQEPTYPDSVLARHAVREKAAIDRVTKMVTSLEE